MLELIGLLGGGLMRLFPNIMTFFEKGRDLKYELLRMDKEAELEKTRADNRMHEIAAVNQASVDSSWASGLVEALRAEGSKPPLVDAGNWWINLLNGLNSSVRPILTYWWCLVLYTTYKFIFIVEGVRMNMPLLDFAPLLVTDFDKTVIGSIIGFWFVDRALRKEK